MTENQPSVRSLLKPAAAAPIRTSVLELIEALSSLTHDDHLVLSAVKEIFATHKIVTVRSLAPVRLVANNPYVKSGGDRHRPRIV